MRIRGELSLQYWRIWIVKMESFLSELWRALLNAERFDFQRCLFVGTGQKVHAEKYFLNLIKSNRNQIYFPFPDWFRTKRTSVWFQINQKMVYTIWFWVDLIRFRKDLSVCLEQLWRNGGNEGARRMGHGMGEM